MRKIMRDMAWFFYTHDELDNRLLLGTSLGAGIMLGLGIGIANWLLIITGVLCFLVLVFRMTICQKFLANEKNPKIAIAKAQEILKENPQLNPPLNNHTELVKWLKSYEVLSLKEEKLATTTERLNKLPEEKKELETNKEKLETKIKTLKSELGIS